MSGITEVETILKFITHTDLPSNSVLDHIKEGKNSASGKNSAYIHNLIKRCETREPSKLPTGRISALEFFRCELTDFVYFHELNERREREEAFNHLPFADFGRKEAAARESEEEAAREREEEAALEREREEASIHLPFSYHK